MPQPSNLSLLTQSTCQATVRSRMNPKRFYNLLFSLASYARLQRETAPSTLGKYYHSPGFTLLSAISKHLRKNRPTQPRHFMKQVFRTTKALYLLIKLPLRNDTRTHRCTSEKSAFVNRCSALDALVAQAHEISGSRSS